MKTRKSEIDIKKEIKILVGSSKSKKELVNNVELYLQNITGKELISKNRITFLILLELMNNDKFNVLERSSLRASLNAKDIIGRKRFTKLILKNAKLNTFPYCEKSLYSDVIFSNILITCQRYKKLRTENLDKGIPFFIEKDEALTKLKKFIDENADVVEILKEFMLEIKERTILDEIKNRQLPLTAMTKFFDELYDIKENTFILYEKLERKIPQSDIHKTLRKWIEDKEKKVKKLSPHK